MLIDTLITGFDRNCGVGADSGLWATKGCPLANLVYNEMDPVQIWPGGKLSILKQNLREQIAQMCYSAFDSGFVWDSQSGGHSKTIGEFTALLFVCSIKV